MLILARVLEKPAQMHEQRGGGVSQSGQKGCGDWLESETTVYAERIEGNAKRLESGGERRADPERERAESAFQANLQYPSAKHCPSGPPTTSPHLTLTFKLSVLSLR